MTDPFALEGPLGSCVWCGGDIWPGDPHPHSDASCGDTECRIRREWVAAVTEDGAA